jgi:osmotically-inducible protein OsmY
MVRATGRALWGGAWTTVALVAALAAPAVAAPSSQDEWDRQLQEKIEKRLLGQVELHPRNLQIEVREAEVRLSGTVASLEEKRKVERLVWGFVEVRAVENLVQVRPSGRPDMALRQEILDLLDRYTALRRPAVDAQVQEGRAILTGMVEEDIDRVQAEVQAASVSGVTQIDDQIVVAGRPEAPPSSTAALVTSLLANPITFGAVRDLRVEGDGGTITLYGHVASEGQRLEAERLAMSVPGVERVINRIRSEAP